MAISSYEADILAASDGFGQNPDQVLDLIEELLWSESTHDQQSFLELFFLRKMSIAWIAVEMGRTKAEIKKLKRQVEKKLRQLEKQYGLDIQILNS
jgi:predicted DNA-binding protein YlxM (UPF0122 family)